MFSTEVSGWSLLWLFTAVSALTCWVSLKKADGYVKCSFFLRQTSDLFLQMDTSCQVQLEVPSKAIQMRHIWKNAQKKEKEKVMVIRNVFLTCKEQKVLFVQPMEYVSEFCIRLLNWTFDETKAWCENKSKLTRYTFQSLFWPKCIDIKGKIKLSLWGK